MATAENACGNFQTETEREATTAKVTLKITETNEIPTTTTTTTEVIDTAYEQAQEEDVEVLYDSLEVPDIPAAKTSTAFDENFAASRNQQTGVEELELQNEISTDVVDSSEQLTAASDDIPEPIKVLDDIISEFEAASEVKPAASSGENQSEDDGYMSLSRKIMYIGCEEEMSVNSTKLMQLDKNHHDTHFHNYEPNVNNVDIVSKTSNERSTRGQTTLPKVQRSVANVNPSTYSSLPGCGARPTENRMRSGPNIKERNALGIDISAVHSAVLRGDLVKMDEPFANEHPVTIYPGCSSPASRDAASRLKRNQRLLSSVEKHKETCHILKPNNNSSNSSPSSSSTSTSSTDTKEQLMQHMKPPLRQLNKRFNVEQKVRSVSDDDEYSDLSVDQSLSPKTEPLVSVTQPKSDGHMGLVWEINFQTENKKPGKVKKTLKTHMRQRNIHEINSTKCVEKINIEKPKKSIEPEIIWLYGNNNNNNNNNKNKNINMLGKGTFIIRREPKKPIALNEVFDVPIINNNQSKEHDVCLFNDTKDTKFKKSSSLEHRSKRDLDFNNTKTQIRHSFDVVTPQAGNHLTSPRERLSLNLEAQHRNSLNKDACLSKPNPPVNNKSPIEETARPTRNASLKRSDAQINMESPCEARTQGSLERELAGECVALNYVDSTPLYNYKSVTAGCLKNSDYVTDLRTSCSTTPHTDLAPTLEEDEEQYSDFSYSSAPLKQIENNISKLLRGDMPLMQPNLAEIKPTAKMQRVLEFRPGVHKSESAKEMLLSQNSFGPLPPSPPLSNPALFDYDAPLPPSPHDDTSADDDGDNDVPKAYPKNMTTTAAEIHAPGRAYIMEEAVHKGVTAKRHLSDHLPPPPSSTPPLLIEEVLPPAIPPHRGHSVNTIKSWSIDSNYKRRSPRMLTHGNSITTTPTGAGMAGGGGGSLSVEGNVGVVGGVSSMRYVNYGTKRSLKQSPREEHRLQTSFSLPETPIFARGCDIPRTPFRRPLENPVSGSRTAPRSNTSHSIAMGNSIVGITGGVAAGSAYSMAMCRQHSINHALVSNEMLRLSGAPARGWYPKQRSMRPASTENIDRLTSIRFLDSGTGMHGTGQARKPCTLPPNLTPSFLNKSPREALRRVTSLLIAKKRGNTKERKQKNGGGGTLERTSPYDAETNGTFAKERVTETRPNGSTPKAKDTKKKGIFKNLWKRTKQVSLDQ